MAFLNVFIYLVFITIPHIVFKLITVDSFSFVIVLFSLLMFILCLFIDLDL